MFDKELIVNKKYKNRKLKLCKACVEDVDENESLLLWVTEKRCKSCGMPFGLKLKNGRTVKGPVTASYKRKHYEVCEVCKNIIREEVESNVDKIISDIDRTIDEYVKHQEIISERLAELKDKKFNFAVHHLNRGNSK